MIKIYVPKVQVKENYSFLNFLILIQFHDLWTLIIKLELLGLLLLFKVCLAWK